MVAVWRPRRRRRRCSRTCYRPQTSANRRPDTGAMPAASDSSDYSASASAEQATTESTFAGIVRVRRGCDRIDQTRSDHAGKGRLLSYPFHLYPSQSGDLIDAHRRLNRSRSLLAMHG